KQFARKRKALGMSGMSQPPLDVLTQRSYPELAAALRARSGRILERWAQAVRQALPAADELTFTQLRDNLPKLLEQMADALAATGPKPADAMAASSGEHGGTRFHQKYDLAEVLAEYSLLRRMVVDETAAELGRPLALDESLALNLGTDA